VSVAGWLEEISQAIERLTGALINPSGGEGSCGLTGRLLVVKIQMGPSVSPSALLEITCQKYVVFGLSGPGLNRDSSSPEAITASGGFPVDIRMAKVAGTRPGFQFN
jgi:hypothetical protein